MAKYQINYACGHGSTEKQLYGKTSERDSYIEWAEQNMVCPDCYKAKKRADDAAAKKMAKICLVPALAPIISIEVNGQIEANKDALYALGYRWSDSTDGGLFGYFSANRPQRVLALLTSVESEEQIGAWISAQQTKLAELGYEISGGLSIIDLEWLKTRMAEQKDSIATQKNAKEKLAEIQAIDPKPPISPLRNRIAELEKSSGQKWNGKIYGRKGGYNFYVANTKYSATDAEVEQREAINKARADWEEKYKAEIEAAK